MNFILNENDVNISNGIVGLYFYNSLVFPFVHNKIINLVLSAEDRAKVKFFGIDVDHFILFPKIFDIKSTPTVIIFKDSTEIKRIIEVPNAKTFLSEFDI